MFLGVPFNIASYSFLLHIIGSITGYKPRYLRHVIGDAHIYDCHIQAIEKTIMSWNISFSALEMVNPLTDIDSIQETDMKITNYISDERILIEMIA